MWTKAEVDAYIQEIVAYKKQGLSQTEVAAKLGKCQSSISQFCSRHGIYGWFNNRNRWGSNNPSFENGLSKSTVGKITAQVLIEAGRDLFTCEKCKSKGSLELNRHHIDRDRSNNHISNLAVLCPRCHRQEHAYDQYRDHR
jgi:5-methylcytosine-specific restriction endonuclease McrA